MSYNVGVGCCPEMGYCEALVRGIDMVGGLNNTSLRATPVGTVQALLDPINRSDAAFDEIMGDNGGIRKIRVKRLPRGVETDAVDEVTCDVTTTAGYVEQCVEVLQEVSVSFETSAETMQRYCDDMLRIVNNGEAGDNYFVHVELIMSKMNALREKINSKVIALLSANVGNNIPYDSNVFQTLPMITAADGAKLEIGIQRLIHDMKVNEVYGQFLVSGLGVFDRFNTSAQWGCCNQNGLNWDAMISTGVPYKYYSDVKLGAKLNDPDLFFVFAPGMTQFVYTNDTLLGRKNQDRRHGNTTYGTIMDPLLPGVRYDVSIEETNCVNGRRKPSYYITIYLRFDLAFTPANAYSSGDRLLTANGASNGVFWYRATAV